MTDASGNVWVSDSSYITLSPPPSNSIVSPATYITVNLANVPASLEYAALWQTERYTHYGKVDVEYLMPVTQVGT